MGIDPSGNASLFSSSQAASIGRQVHKIIGDDFYKKTGGENWLGSSVYTILGKAGPVGRLAGRVFPDLVDTGETEVYAIKPMTIAGPAMGFAQLWAHVTLFNKLDPSGGWHDGNSYDSTNAKGRDTIELASLPCVVVVSPPVSGMIYYEPFTINQVVRTLAQFRINADSARIQQAVGVASMLALLGGI
jgi:hypothetical protein